MSDYQTIALESTIQDLESKIQDLEDSIDEKELNAYSHGWAEAEEAITGKDGLWIGRDNGGWRIYRAGEDIGCFEEKDLIVKIKELAP